MTAGTSSGVQEQAGLSADDEQLLRELTERARADGLRLTGEGGLPGELAAMVIEGALEGELTTTSAMRSTTRPTGMAGIPATVGCCDDR